MEVGYHENKTYFITILTLSIVLAGCTNERLNKEQNENNRQKVINKNFKFLLQQV